MNDKSLSSLYRRLTASASLSGADADRIANASSCANAPSVAGSSRLADLRRMLEALRPASEALASAMREADSTAAPRRDHHRVVAHHVPVSRHSRRATRITRWVASIAACLVVALFATHHRETGVPTSARGNVAMASVAKDGDRIFTSQDRIFAATDEHAQGGKSARDHRDGDLLFRGSFSGG